MSIKALFDKATSRSYERRVKHGVVGKINPVGPPTFEVVGRPDFLWVTLADKTVIQARNEAGVPQEELAVKLIVFHSDHVIIGRDTSGTLVVPTPTPPSGVLPHPIEEHSDADITAAASGDVLAHNGTDWVDETPLTTSAGAGSAGKLVRLDAAGHVDATMINDGDIDHTAIANIGTNSHATIDSHIAAAAAHGATGAVVGTTNSQTLTNKTLDSTNISTLTAKTTPVDADSAVIVDSAAANVFKAVTWTGIKAFLKTYFDTLYNLYVHPNHTGDVTSVGDGATTIAANAVTTAKILNSNVTYAKIQNVSATDKVLGRSTAGAGVIEEIALTAFARSLIDDIDAAAARTTLGLGTIATEAETAYALLAGRAGGQTLKGGTGSGDDLTLQSTNHATKGTIIFGSSGYDEVNNRLGIRTTAPANLIEMVLPTGNTSGQGLQLTGQGNGFIKFVNNTAVSSAFLPAFDATGSDGVNFGMFLIGRPPDDAGDEAAIRLSARTRADGTLANAILYEIFNFATRAFTVAANGRVSIGPNVSVPLAMLHVEQPTLGSVVQRLQSTANNDDVIEDVVQGRIATTDATVTTLATITIPASTTVGIHAFVTARRTGGVAGTAEDGAFYRMAAMVTNIAGVATLNGPSTTEFENQAGWNATIDVTGATARVRVTGAVNNSITWHATIYLYPVSS